MATVGELIIQIGADLGDLDSQLKAVASAVKNFSTAFEDSQRAIFRTGEALTAFGGALAGFLALSISEASKAQAEQVKLAAALKATGAAVDPRPFLELAAQLQSVTRFSDEAIIGVQRILIQFGATADQVRQLTPLILDLSAALDRDLNQTAQNVGRGLTGMDGALSRFIGKLPDGTSLSEDFGTAVSQLEGRFKGFAEATGRTLPDSLAKLRNATSDVLEALGTPFLVPLTAAANALQGLAERITAFARAFPGLTAAVAGGTAILAALTAGAGFFLIALSQLPAALGLAAQGFLVLKTAIATTGEFLAANPVVLIIAAIAAAAIALVVVTGKFDDVKKAVVQFATDAKSALENVLTTLAPFVAAIKDFLEAAFRLAVAFVKIAAASPPIVAAFELIKLAIAIVIANVRAIVEGIKGLIIVLTPLIQVLTGVVQFLVLFAEAAAGGVTPAFIAFVTTLKTVFMQLADGVALVVQGLTHFNVDEVKRGIALITGAFEEGRKAGIEAYHTELKKLQDDKKPPVPSEHKKSLDEITAAYQEAALSAELFGLQSQKAAAQQAQGELSRPGLTEQDFQAIEDARLRTVAAGAQTELQIRIAGREQELRELDALGVKSKEITAKRIEAQKDLQQAQTQLATVSLEVTRKAAQDIVQAEKRAVESRVTLLKTVLDETKTVEHARVEAVQQAADQQLRIQQVLEQTRIGLIQRAIQIQQSLSSAISSAQEALFRAQTSREDAAFRARERARTDAVRQGLLDQTEAQRQSEDDRFALAVRTAQRRIDLEQSQLQQAQALNQLQAGFAVEEARSKVAALEAENAARKAQLQSNFDLRRLDLLNADEINRLELKSTLDRINAENEALARQGGISPQEAAARQRELDNILAGFAQKRSTILQQLDLQQKASASAQVAIDQETAAKRLQVEAELKVQLANLASADVKTRADAAARIAQLEGQLAGDIAEQQEALKARGLTPGEIKKITAPAEAVLNSVKNLGTEQVNIVQGALAQLQSVYESFARSVSSALQPVVDAVKLLTNPALLQQLLRIPTPALPGGGVGPLPAGGVGGGAGASVVPTQQVTNLTIPLQVNGQPLATAVLRFIDGQLQSFEQSTA